LVQDEKELTLRMTKSTRVVEMKVDRKNQVSTSIRSKALNKRKC